MASRGEEATLAACYHCKGSFGQQRTQETSECRSTPGAATSKLTTQPAQQPHLGPSVQVVPVLETRTLVAPFCALYGVQESSHCVQQFPQRRECVHTVLGTVRRKRLFSSSPARALDKSTTAQAEDGRRQTRPLQDGWMDGWVDGGEDGAEFQAMLVAAPPQLPPTNKS